MITKHADVRMQQRAIPPLAVEVFERFGSSMRHEGATILYMDKKARKRVEEAFGGPRSVRVIERWLDLYVCIEGGKIITVAPRTQKLKRDVKRRRQPQQIDR